jgi:predicted house-cleaning noncanonical NTP pyrophosphatase (MazG superfamily)
MTNTTFLIGILIINTLFLLREFIKSVILSKRLEEAEDTLEVKILEVINLEQYMGKQIQELRSQNKQLKEQQKELTPAVE